MAEQPNHAAPEWMSPELIDRALKIFGPKCAAISGGFTRDDAVASILSIEGFIDALKELT